MRSVNGYQFRNYIVPLDFLVIRDCIVSSWALYRSPVQWTLERWIFSRYVARRFTGISEERWGRGVGIWERNGRIVSVIHSEGENSGEIFFQITETDLPEELYQAMFAFAEEHLGIEQDGFRYYALRIPHTNAAARQAAVKGGFTDSGKKETTSMLDLGKGIPAPLPGMPPGLKLVPAAVWPDHESWGEAHARAFGYYGRESLPGAAARRDLYLHAPDYRPDLDLSIINAAEETAAFCIAWYDAVNRIGILEPVGTIPDYRRMGLGRAVIHEAARRLRKLGATHLLVGSDQPFYARLGFTPAAWYEIWEKKIGSAE